MPAAGSANPGRVDNLSATPMGLNVYRGSIPPLAFADQGRVPDGKSHHAHGCSATFLPRNAPGCEHRQSH